MMKRKEHRYLKQASMTVELALLFPIILILIMIVVYYSFYAYDYITTYMYSNYICKREMAWIMEDFDTTTNQINWEKKEEKGLGWQLLTDYTSREKEVEKEMRTFLDKALLCSDCEDITIHMSYGEVVIDYNVQFSYANRYGLHNLLLNFGSIEGRVNKQEIEAKELIRLVRGIIFKD